MKILILAPDYPDNKRANFSFVKQLVEEMARQGHIIQVVAPYSITHNRGFYKTIEYKKIDKSEVIVYRPHYFSFSTFRIGKYSISEWCINRAFQKGLKMLKFKPDIVYGHFWTSAYQGFHYAKKNRLPLFVATGESEIDFVCDTTDKKLFCNYVNGVICVSTKNCQESLSLSLTEKEKCVIVPNAIDANLFKLHDKKECRKKLEFPDDVFIVAFVGWFNERKGSTRVAEAINKIRDEKSPVYSVFVGSGLSDPICDNILFKGILPHNQIPEYLNTADAFVLPTQSEGCCNAVIEAMACGLPIISSNLPFNWDVLDDTNSIMVDPNNVDEIAEAIKILQSDIELRKRLSEGSVKKAESLTINNRAARIIDFIKERMINK